jgi:hypothetical protein
VAALLAAGTPDTSGAGGGDIRQTLNDLRTIRMETSTVVPPRARTLLGVLKGQLRDLILETLNAEGRSSWSLKQFEGEVNARLHGQMDVDKEWAEDEERPYGALGPIEIRRPQGHRNLIAAMTHLGIECGVDTSLYLFLRSRGAWRLILALEANAYEEISGAQGTFRYVVPPPGKANRVFVVVAEVPPWCTSNWRTIRYRVLQVSPTPYEPRVLLDRVEDAYLGGDPDLYRLKPERGGFSIYWHSGHDFDLSLIPLRVARYKIAGNRPIRVPPIAFRPEDFLNEWIKLPWEDAGRWSLPRARLALQLWHHWFQVAKEGECCFASIWLVQPCNKPTNQWQLGLDVAPKKLGELLSEELFFTIIQKGNTYYMATIGTRRPPGCPGETPPKRERNWRLP